MILCGDTDRVQEVKQAFNETIKMDDRGEPSYLLGLRLTRNHNGIRVNQAKNIEEHRIIPECNKQHMTATSLQSS